MPVLKRLAEHFRHTAYGELPSHIADAVEKRGSYNSRDWRGRRTIFKKAQILNRQELQNIEQDQTPRQNS